MPNFKIDLQIAVKDKFIPDKKKFIAWLNAAKKIAPPSNNKHEICIRIIDEKESAALNKTYRQKDNATNILSFAYQDDELLGDIAICASIVAREAKQQNKELLSHWAHIVIHGYLHLLGFSHQTSQKAAKMEQLEVEILQKLGYSDPYL